MKSHNSTTTEIRRFGYYIPKVDGTWDVTIHDRVRSADVLAELHEITSVVFNLQPVVFAADIVERNYRELIDSIEDQRLRLNNLGPAVSITVALDGTIATAQKITNFLSSASAFLGQTEKQLKHVHGETSPEVTTWNKRRNDLHADRFSYRFLYELRNFAQHYGLPLSSFSVAGERATENAPMVFRIGALILRDKLLMSGYKWKKLQEEIQQQPSEFDLLPLAMEYLHSLRQLCLQAVELQGERLSECACYFDAVRRTLKIPMGAVPVIFIGVSDLTELRHEVIPMEQFEWLLRKYYELPKASETG